MRRIQRLRRFKQGSKGVHLLLTHQPSSRKIVDWAGKARLMQRCVLVEEVIGMCALMNW